MSNIQRVPNYILQSAMFFPEYQSKLHWQSFLASELGKIYQSIPFKELGSKIKKKRKGKQGSKAIFDEAGEIGLMFLKSYSKLSDEKLIARLNTDISYQFFCGIRIPVGSEIKDGKLPSQIRCSLANRVDIMELQEIFASFWAPDLNDTNINMQDATCYETSLRYPTSVKILWESAEWVYKQLKKNSKVLGVKVPRTKYSEQKMRTLIYRKRKRKSHKERQRRGKSLVYFLKNLIAHLEISLSENKGKIAYRSNFWKRLNIIKKVQQQQDQWFNRGEMPKDLIVSIDKHYIRPIVRGKENKRVEFGAKVNIFQVDGINFIEHLSFSAFHEGVRMAKGIKLQQSLFKKRVTQASGDKLYANNKNRKFCSKRKIVTNFTPKGRRAKDESERKKVRSKLNKKRATQLEGSFGVEKEIYGLKRIRARTEQTEILMIFCGIFTANSVRMSKKLFPKKEEKSQRA